MLRFCCSREASGSKGKGRAGRGLSAAPARWLPLRGAPLGSGSGRAGPPRGVGWTRVFSWAWRGRRARWPWCLQRLLQTGGDAWKDKTSAKGSGWQSASKSRAPLGFLSIWGLSPPLHFSPRGFLPRPTTLRGDFSFLLHLKKGLGSEMSVKPSHSAFLLAPCRGDPGRAELTGLRQLRFLLLPRGQVKVKPLCKLKKKNSSGGHRRRAPALPKSRPRCSVFNLLTQPQKSCVPGPNCAAAALQVQEGSARGFPAPRSQCVV